MRKQKATAYAVKLPGLYGVAEVAKQRNIDTQVIYTALEAKQIICHQAGGILLFTDGDIVNLDAYLENRNAMAKARLEALAGYMTLKEAIGETGLTERVVKILVDAKYWDGFKEHPGKSGRWLVSKVSVSSYLESRKDAGKSPLESSSVVEQVACLAEMLRVAETRVETPPANNPLLNDLFERIEAFEAQIERQPKRHLPYEVLINGLFYRVLAFEDTLTHLQAVA